MLASAAAVPVETRLARPRSDDDRLRYRQFQNVVEEMAIASGIPKPQAYVIPDDDPNAFATGRDPEHASIAVTEGLLRSLNREELQGVVAHEMGHIRNLDIRLMTVVAALVGAVVLLADWSGRAMRFGGGQSRGRAASKDGGGARRAVLRGLDRRHHPGAGGRRGSWRLPSRGSASTWPTRPAPSSRGTRSALAGALEKIEGASGADALASSAAPRTCASPIRSASDRQSRRPLGGSLGDASADGQAHAALKGMAYQAVAACYSSSSTSQFRASGRTPAVSEVIQPNAARLIRLRITRQIDHRPGAANQWRPSLAQPVEHVHVERTDERHGIEHTTESLVESAGERKERHGQVEVILVDLRAEHEIGKHAPAGDRRPGGERPARQRTPEAPADQQPDDRRADQFYLVAANRLQ